MNDIRKPPAVLTILTALAGEAKTLVERKKNKKKDTTFVSRRHTSESGTTVIIQCGIGRDTLLRVAAPQLKNTSIVGNIGVSGGLAPDLVPGTVILGDQIVTSGNHHTTYQAIYTPSAQLLDILESTLKKNALPYRRGPLLCTPQPLDSPEKKAAAYLKTGALAVDMESAGAAEAARQAALPFFCIRVVCDPAGRRVEKKLLAGVDNRGNSRPMQLINPLIRRPWLLAHLFIMARDFYRALAGMRRVWNVAQKPLVDFADSNSTARASYSDLQRL
ncbi:MAG: hypothetical protein GQ559_11795 [Desulfobulbaceae bacterium]|nr:hypothetical protein [Desulfobulbaceae bacterium]